MARLGWCAVSLLAVLSVGNNRAQMVGAAQPSFEVATIRRADPASGANGHWSMPGVGRFEGNSVSLALLIRLAYGVNDNQIAGKPSWMESDLYDVQAKPESGIALSREELKPRLQNLLAERFHLQTHLEQRPQKGLALVVAKGGPKMPVGRGGPPAQGDRWLNFRRGVEPGQMHGSNWTMAFLASNLSVAEGRPVVDRTGLAGTYEIDLVYASDPEKDAGLPSLATEVSEALGLRLEAAEVPVETVVIDHIDRLPTEN